MTADELTNEIKQEAARLGFALTGICPAISPPGWERFQEWLAAGYAGEMRYLPERSDAYQHPESIMAGVRSIVMLAMNYRTNDPEPISPATARIARYAWGTIDYHDLIHQRLKGLMSRIEQLVPDCRTRGVVDTAPLLEREFAQLAGLGWIGKNTLLLNRSAGSWFFLAALLIDRELTYDLPFSADHCGTCTACLDACPTHAFPQPYVLDATKCISYLTIEKRDAIPRELREGIGDWLFGCDVCQEVCPWNRRSPLAQESEFRPSEATNPVDLLELFTMDEQAFRARFRNTPLWRSKRRGILRNAAIVLGNQKPQAAFPVLCQALTQDPEPLVRAACAWALGQFQEPKALLVLQEHRSKETDATVQQEIAWALNGYKEP